MMHFRSKELDRRSAFPAKEMGKRTLDAWNHERVYVDRQIITDAGSQTLAEFLLPVKITPLDFTITNDFFSALTVDEQIFLDDLSAGYNTKEISKRNSIDKSRLTALRLSLQQKAVTYL
jgi:spermidine/putrescine-binding protein